MLIKSYPKLKNYNHLDGDRAAEHHDEVMGKHNRDRILDAYRLGAADKLSRLKNQNPYSKNKDKMRYIAYDNGYES